MKKINWRLASVLLLLTLCAFLVRVRNLDPQILGGDELHMLKVASGFAGSDIPALVTEFDFSIPLALMTQGVSAWVPLSEWSLRLLFLIVGSLAPGFFMLGARRFVSPAIALLFGIVIAAHPFFIFYSRFIRPYGLCVILLFLVLLLLDRWIATGRKKLLLGIVLAGALAGWLQLVSLITLAGLFAGALLRILIFGRVPGNKVRASLFCGLTGLACLGSIFLLYLPALSGIRAQILEGNLGQGALRGAVLWRNAAIFAGFPGKGAVLVFLFLTLAGAVVHFKGKPDLALFLIVPALLQPLVILILQPRLFDFSYVLARYNFFILPLWLLLACVGAVRLAQPILSFSRTERGERKWVALLAVVFLCLWFFAGPYGEIYEKPNAFAHHNIYQSFAYKKDGQWNGAFSRNRSFRMPGFYKTLKPGARLLEGPAPESYYDNTIALYQRYHGCPVKLITPEDTFWGSPRFDFRNVVVLGPDEVPDFQGADLAVVHKAAAEEIRSFLKRTPSRLAEQVYSPQAVSALTHRLRKICGPPVHEDRFLRVFRLPRQDGAPR